jgi:hypothetical protein
MTPLLLPRSVDKFFISLVRTDIIVSLMPDDPLQSFRSFKGDWLKNVSTYMLPGVCQFVFQVAIGLDLLVFQLFLV